MAVLWKFVPVVFAVAAAGVAQTRPPRASGEKPLVRVNVDLVQVDVIVTDARGNHVADLEPSDFQVFDGGKLRPITNFSYIAGDTRTAAAGARLSARTGPARLSAPVEPARITPGQVNRTIVVVVDDLGMSDQSFMAVRKALETFVERQVGPGDMVAIVTTSGRLGALQQLTADKRLLRAAVAKLSSTNHRTSVLDDDFTCVWYSYRMVATGVVSSGGGQEGGGVAGQAGNGKIQDEDVWLSGLGSSGQAELENDHRSEYYSRLSIDALRRVVDGLQQMPGRKSILLFSEGMPLIRAAGVGEANHVVIDAYNSFLNHADRAGVAVNTIDPRMLPALSSTAETGDTCLDARQTEFVNTQQQLAEIARKTGGISVIGQNDLSGAMARVMKDQLGYYLIGYKPSGKLEKSVLDPRRFRNISIRVDRPGLKVRFHSSLYAEEPKESVADGEARSLADAVASPFAIPNIHLRLASRFWDGGAQAGSTLDTVIQLDARDLAFRTDSDGRHKAAFEIRALTYGADTKPLSTFDKSYSISLTDASYRKALLEGLVQRLELPLKHPGAYQVRAAVLDSQGDQTGSACDFVEVPDLAHGALALSGIAISAAPGAAGRLRYHPGQTVFYACEVLNARPGHDGSVRVEVQSALYKDGQPLNTIAPAPLDTESQSDPKRLLVTDEFRLGSQLTPGDYTLKLSAVDKNAPGRQSVATQSIDFEVTSQILGPDTPGR